ncbi:DNA-directed RNA polymerase subunit alpha [uncultured Dialister sp.]|uniref:DNA-directed RNA polymerase subunit alpha n=1 Tax=uncultured Dialister sp. TaxID=278064 RepID=UPI0025E5C001|nr:DNA-directed RNA polymerase subunit alpha [uncultured Dialister sp.]
MIENTSFTIKTVELSDDKRHGKFECEPLERGYGITLGNSLRRVLLSSLDGVAITSIKIDGVLHEFSTIPGVREDVTDMILNLKKIRFIAHDEATFPITRRIDITKEGIFHAGDMQEQLPAEIDVLNKDLAICTLDSNAHLGMEMTINRGHGYVPFTKNKREDDQITVIPIDSIYSPVVKCNYTVSDTRVGNEMDFDKLTLEVDTDGSVNADDAVATAANILISCFENFKKIGVSQPGSEPVEGEEAEITPVPAQEKVDEDAIRDLPIDDLELSVRAFNCLKRAEINTIGELTDKTEDELTRVRNLGKKSVDEIKEKLANFRDYGLHLKDSRD